jgi:hypothetical protein
MHPVPGPVVVPFTPAAAQKKVHVSVFVAMVLPGAQVYASHVP